jgi:hypothetical protein
MNSKEITLTTKYINSTKKIKLIYLNYKKLTILQYTLPFDSFMRRQVNRIRNPI